MSKVSLGKKIFQFKNASDEEITRYCDIVNINCNVDLIRGVSREVEYYSKFIDHYRKYGSNVTIEKFLSRPETTNSKKIQEHYGVVIEAKPRNNVYDPEYISKRDDISLEEAVAYIEKYKSDKATSKDNFIKKYGDEIGQQKYKEWFEKSLKVGVAGSDSSRSKRHRDFYLNSGYDLEDSIDLAAKYNRENSPLHIEYYIKRGKSIDQARKAIRKIHDKKIGRDCYREKLESEGFTNSEIDSIIKETRGVCSREKMGVEEFVKRIAKTRKTFEQKGMWIPLENMSDYELYRRRVWKETNRNNLLSLKNSEKRGLAGTEVAYHLDHKYSIQQGYINGVPPELIGSINNLEFIPWEDNVKKQSICSISEEELYENKINKAKRS